MITEAQQSMTDDLVKRLRAGKDAVYKIGLKYGALEPICGGDIEDAEDLVLSVPLTIALIEAQAAENAKLTEERDTAMTDGFDERQRLQFELQAAESKVERLRAALNLSWGDILLMAGEMTAGEARTVKAVLAGIRARAGYEETGP